tara:strand:+ start:44 stop:514 length:471 start_codon:yes stop_codon:yes gene_type:complete
VSNFKAHPSSIIETNDIGEGTQIWAFTHICEGVSIGKNCMIGEGVHIGRNVQIGDNCRIQNHSLLYEGVEMEDDVFIGPNTITTNDMYPRVGGDWSNRFRKTTFKHGSSVGANSTIVCGITLNEGCMVGAGAVVTRDVEKKSLVMGVPARHEKYLK